jgi:HAMP domain-containing protein
VIPSARARFRLGRSGLRFRVATLVGIGVVVPAALVAGLSWSRLSTLDARLLGSREEAAVAVADHLDEELRGDLEALQRMASSLTPSLEGHRADAKEREILRRGYLGFRFVGGVFLLDAQGNLLLEEPARERPAVPSTDLPELGEVLRTGRPSVSGLVREGEGFRIYALVAVMDWRGRLSGVVGGRIDPAMARQTVILRHLAPGQEGHADLVDRAGTVLASTDRSRLHARGTCPTFSERVIRERQPAVRLCRECHRHGSPASVIAGASLGNAPWAVTLVQPEEAVLATSGAVPGSVPLLALGVLLFAGVFAWGAARSVIDPLEKLTAEAEKIAGGHLGEPIPELGTDEIGRLGASLDRMRASLAELVRQLGLARDQLEHRVEERTRELAEANEKLRERDQQRARLLQTVITAQEDERKRVARELHDETTQGLAVLVMGLESAAQALRAGGPTPRLDEVKAVAVHLLDEIHRLILDLRPSVLDDLGLYSAIRWYAERHLQARGLAVRWARRRRKGSHRRWRSRSSASARRP